MAKLEQKIDKSYTSPLERAFVAFTYKLEPFVPAFVRPNHITVVSFVSCVAGGLSFYLSSFGRGWLLVAITTLTLHFTLDNLDGAVARERGQTSDRGRFLDIFTDCIGIAAVFLGIGHSPYATMDVVLAPMILWYLHLVLMYNWMQLKGKWIFPLLSNFELMLLIMVCSLASFVFGPLSIELWGHSIKLFDLVAATGGILSLGELFLSASTLYRSLD